MRVSDLFVWVIRGYQRLISRYTPPMCRFQPTCSHYAIVSLQRHGLWRGGRLSGWRLMRCNPFHPGGLDPVPEALGRLGSADPSARGGSVEQ